MTQRQAGLLQPGGQNVGQAMDTPGDALQPLWAVVHRVQAGDVGQQHLRGTDIRVGLLAADMLLAGLHRHAQRGVAGGIAGNADDAARHRTFKLVAAGEEGGVRAAVAHRHTEALRGAEHHVGALLARRGQQHQGHDVGGHAGDDFARFQFGQQRAVVVQFAGGTHLLQQHAEHAVQFQHFFRFIDDDVEAEGFGAGAHHVQRLRMHVVSHEEAVGVFQLAGAFGQGHRFSGGGGFIQQRSGSQIQAGQIEGHGLEVQQRFQAALRHFRLIRGISGVPTRIFQHVAQDHRRRQHGAVAHADIGFVALILRGDRLQLSQRLVFGRRVADRRRPRQLNVRRHDLLDQRAERASAHRCQQLLALFRRRADVAFNERFAVFELAECLSHCYKFLNACVIRDIA